MNHLATNTRPDPTFRAYATDNDHNICYGEQATSDLLLSNPSKLTDLPKMAITHICTIIQIQPIAFHSNGSHSLNSLYYILNKHKRGVTKPMLVNTKVSYTVVHLYEWGALCAGAGVSALMLQMRLLTASYIGQPGSNEAHMSQSRVPGKPEFACHGVNNIMCDMFYVQADTVVARQPHERSMGSS